MPKKSKAKEKITGTPDVVKFKTTKEYLVVKSSAELQDTTPLVSNEVLDSQGFLKVSRSLHLISELCKIVEVSSLKDYRFYLHHPLLSPQPQLYPVGYPISVIKSARSLVEKPVITFNGEEFSFSEDIRRNCDTFLRIFDKKQIELFSYIEAKNKADFAEGLKRFKNELKVKLTEFDDFWTDFEKSLLDEVSFATCKKVFHNIDALIKAEAVLSLTEERMRDDEREWLIRKETSQGNFMKIFFEAQNDLSKSSLKKPTLYSAIQSAEAILFYHSKTTEEQRIIASRVIDAYVSLRLYLGSNDGLKHSLVPQLKENAKLVRLMEHFYESLLEAEPILKITETMPRLTSAVGKVNTWLVKSVIAEEMMNRRVQST